MAQVVECEAHFMFAIAALVDCVAVRAIVQPAWKTSSYSRRRFDVEMRVPTAEGKSRPVTRPPAAFASCAMRGALSMSSVRLVEEDAVRGEDPLKPVLRKATNQTKVALRRC